MYISEESIIPAEVSKDSGPRGHFRIISRILNSRCPTELEEILIPEDFLE